MVIPIKYKLIKIKCKNVGPQSHQPHFGCFIDMWFMVTVSESKSTEHLHPPGVGQSWFGKWKDDRVKSLGQDHIITELESLLLSISVYF